MLRLQKRNANFPMFSDLCSATWQRIRQRACSGFDLNGTQKNLANVVLTRHLRVHVITIAGPIGQGTAKNRSRVDNRKAHQTGHCQIPDCGSTN